MSFVFVSMGMMAFVSAAMLTIDVGQIMTARTQAQRSADAGALAGATAMVFNSFDDHSDNGPAKSSAVNIARANLVIDQVPSVNPSDVNFIMNPVTGRQDIIEVTVYRNGARGNPVLNFIGPIFGMDTADISATARAAAIPAGSEICVLPLTIPDRWIENQTGPWTPDDTFDMYASQGNRQNVGAPLVPADRYVAPGSIDATGYHPVRDKGLRLTLKNNNENKIAPGMYNAWDLPGSVGGDDYRENIMTCNGNLVTIGDTMSPENGNMVGTHEGGSRRAHVAGPWSPLGRWLQLRGWQSSSLQGDLPSHSNRSTVRPGAVHGRSTHREEPARAARRQLPRLLHRGVQRGWRDHRPDHLHHGQEKSGRRPPAGRLVRSGDRAGEVARFPAGPRRHAAALSRTPTHLASIRQA